MASVRGSMTKWSRALIANASCNSENKVLVEQISGCSTEILRKSAPDLGRACRLQASVAKKITSKKILKRSRRMRKREPLPSRLLPSSIAKRLVKKRTQLLKSLLPGGESMDDESLIKETLDYIVSLRAQVDVMRSLARMSGFKSS
ncbi:hypothetical protein CDL15_Pgr012580 [Punica granatum]|nr:hypothetical protein CDL15_Pgr012580 [Punica granatum]